MAVAIPSSLRLEFAIPGVATILSGGWMVEALARLIGYEPLKGLPSTVLPAGSSTGLTVLVIGAGACLIYLFGILVVMLTYIFPVRQIIHRVRIQRVATLSAVRKNSDNGVGSNLDSAFVKLEASRSRVAWAGRFRNVTRGSHPESVDLWKEAMRWATCCPRYSFDMSLLLSYGRQHAQPGVMAEYEYRRSVRQITAGCLPALAFLMVASIADLSSATLAGYVATLTVVVAGSVIIGLFCVSIWYQEQVAQCVLIDCAFIAWETDRRGGDSDTRMPGVVHE